MKRNLFMHGHLETWDLEPGTKLYGDVPIHKKDPETGHRTPDTGPHGDLSI